MKLLLDTNALLWLLGDDPRLGVAARQCIVAASALLVSDASLWEVSIKVSIGKLDPIRDFLHSIRELGFQRIGIADSHLSRLEALPLHHRDPFDRMLVAQALSDDLTVLTADRRFAEYGVRMINARE